MIEEGHPVPKEYAAGCPDAVGCGGRRFFEWKERD